MDKLLKTEVWHTYWAEFVHWLTLHVLVPATLVQFILLIVLYWLSGFAAHPVKRRLLEIRTREGFDRIVEDGAPLARPLAWLVLQWLAVLVAIGTGGEHYILEVTATLITVWVLIRIGVKLVKDDFLRRTIAWLAWTIAALNILNLLDPTITVLKAATATLGNTTISLYQVVVSTILLAFLLWVAMASGRLLEKRIRTSDISPTLQVLMTKSFKIVLVTIAILIVLETVGLDLTTLTVFSGAVGLGIGFGLQKIVSNLISGFMLLMDKSIKPGDVISVDDTYGWVNSLGGRYVSVVTRDGTEHLIPNENLITSKVINWTHSDSLTRIKLPIHIHYKSDVRKAIKLCLEATKDLNRVLQIPEPKCLLIGFGESSLNLEVRFWIKDPEQGVRNIRSAVLLNIWDAFKENDIVIPYPQRDLHLCSNKTAVEWANENVSAAKHMY